MILLLDANVLVDFQRADLLGELVKASATVEMAVVEQVLDEVTLVREEDSSDTVGRKRKARALLTQARLQTLEILPRTPEAALLQTLLTPVNTVRRKDQGEAASVAVATGDPRLVFVTGDKTAVLWSLNELFGSGERVMRIPVFVRTLHAKDALGAVTVKRIAERAASHGVVPSWWDDWLANL